MNVVPSSPDPERRPTAPAAGPRRRASVPALSVGTIDDVRPGSLLVAMPGLTDPTFAGTVVYVLDHSENGTVGVVLGHPSEVRIGDVLPGWSDLAVEPGVFHVGGPCESDTALCLAVTAVPDPAGAATEPVEGLRRVSGDVHLVDLDADPALLAGRLTALRVFAGYAGWSPMQLAAEVAEGSWACIDGTGDDVVAAAGGAALWRRVLTRQTGTRAVLTTAPAEPALN